MSDSYASKYIEDGWQNLDAIDEPGDLLKYLELAETAPAVQRTRQETYRALARASGVGVDVGFGSGLAVNELAEMGLEPTGVELSQFMIDAAVTRFPGRTFTRGSALDLPFDDRSQHWYRAERVFVVLEDPEAALAEARRVLAPGATIVLADPDLQSSVFNSSYPDLEKTAIASWAKLAPNGRIGSRMKGMLHRAGFVDVQVTACPQLFTDLDEAMPVAIDLALEAARHLDTMSGQEIDLVRQDLVERREDFVCSIGSFVTSAIRPELD